MYNIKMPPVGVEFFNKIVSDGYYYIDKTGLVRDLINLKNEVTLFTRPRRFGKSLNMDMLKSFFEIGADVNIFKGLKISEEKELCRQYQGKFPVISISLKDVYGLSYEEAVTAMSGIIKKMARRHQYLLQSSKLSDIDKNLLKSFYDINLTEDIQKVSLSVFSEMLFKHYNEKVVILVDEYDVPLDKAYQNGYYDKMVNFIRIMFSNGLKTNEYLSFAVLTGCLRIARESIFTGLNNFEVYSVSDTIFSEYFGFTSGEVEQILNYYGLEDKASLFKEWYDGYSFGGTEVYCPWDVINQCKRMYIAKEEIMHPYWINSSSNSIIRDIINGANASTREEIEALVSGESITQEIIQEITYSGLEDVSSQKKQVFLWSILYSTGYLTDVCAASNNKHTLVIPNREIYEIYKKQVLDWFTDKACHSVQWGQLCDVVGSGEYRYRNYIKRV